jgi:iron complex outermembrane receptor protein
VNYNAGGNVLGRWTHALSDDSSLTLQAYFDNFKQEQSGAGETANTADFDAQHRFSLGDRNDFTWGLGYREVVSDFRDSTFAAWIPPSAHDHLYSSFVQDEIVLLPDLLKLTVGSKFEHNDYTGFEVEPSARLAWTPTEHQTVWAAVSRAVRTPSWTDMHSDANLLVMPPSPSSPFPIEISSLGNPHLQSEDVTAYELGYRIEATKHVSFDVAGFYNNYDHLIAPTELTTNLIFGPPTYVQIASVDENAGSGQTYGAEVSARWDVTEAWHLTANYSWMQFELGFATPYLQGGPEHQAQLRSALDLPGHMELNAAVSFVDQVMAPYGIAQMTIPSYARVDVGLVWHATKNLELGLWGQNLAQDRHLEFPSYKTTLLTEIPRTVAARITWRF